MARALAALAATCTALAAASAAAPGSATPNVLFIAVDDLRPEHGVYGGQAITPNIDAFAKSAMVFPRNYVQVGVCSPSRAILLTGRYPDRGTHTYDLWKYFRSVGCNVTTLPQAFKDAGYPIVAAAGKIFHPGHASGAGLYPDGGYSAGCKGCGGYNDPPSWRNYLIPPGMSQYPWNVTYGQSWTALPGPDAAHPDAQIAAFAVQQIQAAAASGQPFFIAPGFMKPHLPFIFPERFLELYANYSELEVDHAPPADGPMANLSWTAWGEVSSYADIAQTIAANGLAKVIQHPSDAMPRAKALELRRAYFAATSFNDFVVGQVLDALEASGLANSTVVVLFGDHGWQLGTHGDWGKHTNFESVVRAPLIIRAPGYPQSAGAVAQAFTQHVDIFPTLLELTGLAMPGAEALQGESLVPLLADPALPALPKRGPYAYSQYPRMGTACPPPATECEWPHAMGYTVRSSQWRYTEWVGFNNDTFIPDWDPASSRVHQVELYAHNGDAGGNWEHFENANLAADPRYRDVVANMSALLHAGPNLVAPSPLPRPAPSA